MGILNLITQYDAFDATESLTLKHFMPMIFNYDANAPIHTFNLMDLMPEIPSGCYI